MTTTKDIPTDESREVQVVTSINTVLAKAKEQGAHVLAPMTLQAIPQLHRPVIVTLTIDPDPKKKEVYEQRGGGYSISALGFKKLGGGLGIQWLPEECGRIDDGRNPRQLTYRMVGIVKELDGTWRKIIGDKAIDMDVVEEELTDNYRLKAEKYLEDDKDGPAFRKAFPTPEAVEGWVNEKVRQDSLQMRKHMLARAQSGAMARATKNIGIRETYTAEELRKPFVFPKLVFTPDPNHPQDRAFMLAQGAGATNLLYPASPATLPQAPMVALPERERHEVEFYVPPDSPDDTAAAEALIENIKADFKSADPKQQAEVLQALIKKKGWVKPIQGDPVKWISGHRQKFLDTLLAMPDAAGVEPTLPF